MIPENQSLTAMPVSAVGWISDRPSNMTPFVNNYQLSDGVNLSNLQASHGIVVVLADEIVDVFLFLSWGYVLTYWH